MDETVSASSVALGDLFQTSTFHTGNFLLSVSESVCGKKDKETKGESEMEGVSQREEDRDMERESQA